MGLALVFLHLAGSSAYPTTIFNISNYCVAVPFHVRAPVCFFHYPQHGALCLPSHMLKPFQTSLSHSPLLLPNYLLASSSTDITFHILQSILSTALSPSLTCLNTGNPFLSHSPLYLSSHTSLSHFLSRHITFHTLQSILSLLMSKPLQSSLAHSSLYHFQTTSPIHILTEHYNTECITVKSNIPISYHMTAFKKWCQRNEIPCNITCLTLYLF